MSDIPFLTPEQINYGTFLVGIFVGFLTALLAGLVVSLSEFISEKASALRERRKK